MMVIKERVKGFICVTAHPEGCRKNVLDQIQALSPHAPFPTNMKNVLILGGSTGYGLASRVVNAFGMGSNTLNVSFERPPRPGRTASAGWYHTAALETEARKKGLFARTLNADAFSSETKEQVCRLIQKNMGKIDLLIYSIAAPKRIDSVSGTTYASALKPIGERLHSKTVNVTTRVLQDVQIDPAQSEEIAATVKVMGGEDWELWVKALQEAGLLNQGFKTLAYSYIGSELTAAIYRKGTIGQAKEHLEQTARTLHLKLANLPDVKGAAAIAVNKALVTQASSAIPILPLYVTLLYKVMKEREVHENTLQQMERLFKSVEPYTRGEAESSAPAFPEWFRLDDFELEAGVQEEVLRRWQRVTPENLDELADLEGYWNEFLNLFGFARSDVNYEEEVEEVVPLDLL